MFSLVSVRQSVNGGWVGIPGPRSFFGVVSLVPGPLWGVRYPGVGMREVGRYSRGWLYQGYPGVYHGVGIAMGGYPGVYQGVGIKPCTVG